MQEWALSTTSATTSAMATVNFSQYLNLYSEVYPRYVPYVYWEKDGDRFLDFQNTVNALFYYMPYFIGIPQAILNFTVFTTVILITKHPLLAIKKTSTLASSASVVVRSNKSRSGGNSPRENATNLDRSATTIQIVPRFHRAAFIFIANMALADMVIVIVEIADVALKQMKDNVITATFKSIEKEDQLEQFQALDDRIIIDCRIQIVLWTFAISASMCASVAITVDRFIYIMYGMRYLSIVDSRFVKLAITLAWFIPLILTISSYVGFQDTNADDPECFFGHRVNRVTLVIVLSFLLTILLFTYVVYIRISITAASQRKRGNVQHVLQQKTLQKKIVRKDLLTSSLRRKWSDNTTTSTTVTTIVPGITTGPTSFSLRERGSSSINENFTRFRSAFRSTNSSQRSSGPGKNIQASRQGRAGVYVLILLTVLTLSWIMFIVLNIYDFSVHHHNEEKIENQLRQYNCSGSMAFSDPEMDFPELSFQECLYRAATMPNENTTCDVGKLLSIFKINRDKVTGPEVCSIVIKLFHGKMLDLWQKCSLMLGCINSLVNPIIYAFWYGQFRLRIVQTWKNFFAKCCLNRR